MDSNAFDARLQPSRRLHTPARRFSRRHFFSALVVAGALVVPTGGAALAAPAAPDLEVTVFEGTKSSTSAVPIAELGVPPFTVYNHYVEVKKSRLALKKGAAVKDTMPGGSSVEATLVDDTAPKYKLELVIKDAKGTQVAKGTYTMPKSTYVLPTIIGGQTSGIVPAFRIL